MRGYTVVGAPGPSLSPHPPFVILRQIQRFSGGFQILPTCHIGGARRQATSLSCMDRHSTLLIPGPRLRLPLLDMYYIQSHS
jgi:hypothetical protein